MSIGLVEEGPAIVRPARRRVWSDVHVVERAGKDNSASKDGASSRRFQAVMIEILI